VEVKCIDILSLFCWCQCILFPLCMHQQNNDRMSMHFISTRYASTKQRQYVNAFYFHSVCINKTMTVCQCILFPLCMHQQNNDSMSRSFISHTVIVLLMHTEWK
jgi:hypothetical protein